MNATQEASQPNRAFRLERRSDGVAIVRIDVPGESQNTLKAEFSAEVEAIFAELEADQGLRGVVFVSDKPGSFIAGADIQMLNDCETAEQVTQLARQGQQLFDRIERFRVPVVAAIEGACLGAASN